jgi:hypothetical protein
MQSLTLLSDLVDKTLHEIERLGLGTEMKRQYGRTYKRLKTFFSSRNAECYSADLLHCFLAETEQRFRAGIISRWTRNQLQNSDNLGK